VAAVNPILAGLGGRCPNCGDGQLFEGFIKVAPRCEACGFDLRTADSGDGPAVFIILIVGAIACFGVLFSEMALHWAIWLSLLVWLPAVGALALLLLRPLKGLLVAMQFHNHASEARRGPP
jgi:uncharacterized protein (DUF983 family)